MLLKQAIQAHMQLIVPVSRKAPSRIEKSFSAAATVGKIEAVEGRAGNN
jgi:hypothetical protein